MSNTSTIDFDTFVHNKIYVFFSSSVHARPVTSFITCLFLIGRFRQCQKPLKYDDRIAYTAAVSNNFAHYCNGKISTIIRIIIDFFFLVINHYRSFGTLSFDTSGILKQNNKKKLHTFPKRLPGLLRDFGPPCCVWIIGTRRSIRFKETTDGSKTAQCIQSSRKIYTRQIKTLFWKSDSDEKNKFF